MHGRALIKNLGAWPGSLCLEQRTLRQFCVVGSGRDRRERAVGERAQGTDRDRRMYGSIKAKPPQGGRLLRMRW
jgi:hypothetical protein